jgi:HrpA-like RNA helicase
LYTEETFLSLTDFPVPEIRRCNLNSVVLQLKTLGIDDVLRFDFMDKPSVHALKRALFHLYALGALDDAGRVTRPLGAQIALFPLEPMFGRALLAAAHFGCAEEVLTIVAMLSVDSLFHSARGAARSVSGASGENFDAEETRAGKKMFASVEGDHFTLLRTYQGYSAIGRRSLSDWCRSR